MKHELCNFSDSACEGNALIFVFKTGTDPNNVNVLSTTELKSGSDGKFDVTWFLPQQKRMALQCYQDEW